MSYELIYNRAFIKVSDNQTVPMILIGSSNCYELSGKRARDWYNNSLHTNNRIIGNNDAIIKSVDDYRNSLIKQYDDYNDIQFGYYCSLSLNNRSTVKTTFSAYKSFFINGIKTARTIEEYKQLNINFFVKVSCYDEKAQFIDRGIERKANVKIESTEHLLSTVTEFEGYYKQFNYNVYVMSDMSEYEAKKLKRKRAKEIKERTEVYIMRGKIDNRVYIKKTRLGYQYGYTDSQAKKFKTLNSCQKYIDKHNRKEFKAEKLIGKFLM